MSNREKILVCLIAVLALFIILLLGKFNAPSQTSPRSLSMKEEVPANTKVPGIGEVGMSTGVAIPKAVAQAAPLAETSFRSFDIKVSGGTFTPDTIIVGSGDTVHISLTAVDKSYDFTEPDYGFHVPLPRGRTKLIEFAAVTSGKFTFFCESCGGTASKSKGFLIVVPK